MPNSWKKNARKGDISSKERRGSNSRRKNKPLGCSCWVCCIDLTEKKGKGEMKRRVKYSPFSEDDNTSRSRQMFCSVISAPHMELRDSETFSGAPPDSAKQSFNLGLYIDQVLISRISDNASAGAESADRNYDVISTTESVYNDHNDAQQESWEMVSISDSSRFSSPFEHIDFDGEDLKVN
jgi:hypothetical protein